MAEPSHVRPRGHQAEPVPGNEAAQQDHGAGGVQLDQVVDLGSWAVFTPSLADFLAQAPRVGVSQVLLTAPAPVVGSDELGGGGLLARLRRRNAVASPECPGLVVTVGPNSVAWQAEVAVPVLDAQGRVLLGPAAVRHLETLGWSRRSDVLARGLTDPASCAQAVTTVLLEVLRMAHPADLDWLVCDSPSATERPPLQR